LSSELRLLVACVHTQLQTTRETFPFTSPLLVFCFATPVPFLSFPRLRHTSLHNFWQNQLQRVAFRCQRHLHQPHSFAFNQHGVPHWYVYSFVNNTSRDLLLTDSEISATKQAGCQATQCKKENIKIQKGEIRQGVLVTAGDFQSMKWRHW